MALRPCLDCGTVTQGSRCVKHATLAKQAREARRPSRVERGYGPEWRKAVAAAIEAQPYCSACGHEGSPNNPLTGDHKTPLSAGGTHDPENIDVLCRYHNSVKGSKWDGDLDA